MEWLDPDTGYGVIILIVGAFALTYAVVEGGHQLHNLLFSRKEEEAKEEEIVELKLAEPLHYEI